MLSIWSIWDFQHFTATDLWIRLQGFLLLPVAMIVVYLVVHCLGWKKENPSKWIKASFMVLVNCYLLWIAWQWMKSISMVFLVPFLFLYLCAVLWLRGSAIKKILVTALICMLTVFSYLIGYAVMSLLFGESMKTFVLSIGETGVRGVLSTLIVILILFSAVRLLASEKIRALNTAEMPRSYFVMAGAIPVMTFWIISVLYGFLNHQDIDWVVAFMLPTALLSLFILNGIVFALFFKILQDHRVRMEYELLKQQAIYYNKSMEETKEIYNEISEVRHDLKNYVLCAKQYLEDGKIEEAQKLLTSISDRMYTFRTFVNTSNETLNYIVNTKFSVANAMGIKTSANIVCEVSQIDDVDLVAQMGNILDNAIEACEKVEQKPSIDLCIMKQQGYTSILVKNSAKGEVLQENPSLKTTKDDKKHHGIGVKNIQKIAEKYNGMVDFYQENANFCCKVLLKL